MSEGTNQERLQQNNEILAINNTKIQKAIQKANELPEKPDYEEVYSKLDNGFNLLETINMSTAFKSNKFDSYGRITEYSLLDDRFILLTFEGADTRGDSYYYLYILDVELDIYTLIGRGGSEHTNGIFLNQDEDYVYIGGEIGLTSYYYCMQLFKYNKHTQEITSSNLYLPECSRVYHNFRKVLDDYYLYWSGTRDYPSEWNLYRAKFDLENLKFYDAIKINYTTGIGSRFKMTSPSIFCYGSTTTSTLDYNILKLVNNDTDTIKGNIENLSGTDYFGAKAFANGNVYELNEDLTLGNLLVENAYDYSQGYITTLDDVHYKIGDYVYSFDEDTNTFTKVIETQVKRNNDLQVYMFGKDGSYYKLTPISFLKTTNSSNVIGTIVNGNFYSKPTAINLHNSKLLNGTSIVAVNGVSYKGTMPNNGELNYTPSIEEQTIPAGYTSGGTIAGDSNLVANNIRLGATIFGVEGNLEADKPDQTKIVTPTTGEQVITPDTGYELASVTVEAVTSDIDSNIVAENIKKDVSILGITGTLEGSSSTMEGIKQFSTIEEMQADTKAKEGDLAVVYRSEVQNATVDSRFQTATFPDTVVLDKAITDYVDIRYRAVDDSVMFECMGQLDSSNFMMNCYTETGEVRIEYESSDGITYTRTDTTGNPVDFGTEIYYERAEYWNDVIGKFIQVGGSTFEGLFRYSDDSWSLAPSQLTATPDYVYEKKFYGKNGAEVGTLDTPDNSFADTSAEIVYRIQNAYNNMEPRVLTDSDKTIDTSIYFIPVKYDGTAMLDTSSVTSMSEMFANCTNLTTIPLLDTSSVTDMQRMFYRCTNLTTIPLLNTSSVTNMYDMFNGCTNLSEIPLLDTSNVTNMVAMFEDCKNLTTIPLLDTSKVTSISNMFYGCTNLITIPLLDTSKATDMTYMFISCTNLTAIPQLDTSNVTKMFGMFYDCKNLTTIPLLDTSNVTNMHYMFYRCTNLTTIPKLSTSSVTDMTEMFYKCTSLSDESLNNILSMCANATSYTGTKTLVRIGLTSEQATKCETLSNYSVFTSAGWTTGY